MINHVKGDEQTPWVALTLDPVYSVHLGARSLMRDTHSNTEAIIVEVDLSNIKGKIVNLAVDHAAEANGLTNESLYQGWSSATVLVEEVPVAALTGRYFKLDGVGQASRDVLSVAGDDRMTDTSGKVTIFGSHASWRDEFDVVYATKASHEKMLHNLEMRYRRSFLDAPLELNRGRQRKRKQPFKYRQVD